MSRIIDAKCRLCRREQTKLFLKGEKCYGPNCVFAKKQNYPGKEAYFSSRLSNYGQRLREKQKVKRVYGLNETQMKSLFYKAKSIEGDTGLNLLQLLEMRLDNVAYLLGFAPSRGLARQLVNHGKITVNGKAISIPSFITSEGDKIAISDEKITPVGASGIKTPKWLDKKSRAGVILSKPTRVMMDEGIKEYLIIEHYSK